jgi:ring-1,2-phenylacetyl-CoA epoxidase subunit PaaC
MNEKALKEFLFKLADDQLVLGHRNSEWTGFGPLLEEDIAFSSMAQDKIGHSQALYQLLHALGEAEPDVLAFMRPADKFHNCQLVELPNGEYDFSLIRHFLFDTAELLRFDMLSTCAYEPLAQLARKIKGELMYHSLHANTFIKKLGSGTDESISRLQSSLELALPYALGIFEPTPYEADIIASNIFGGEKVLQEKWIEKIEFVTRQTALRLPEWDAVLPVYGGRIGRHTQHLQSLINEMGEVFRIDPTAEW